MGNNLFKMIKTLLYNRKSIRMFEEYYITIKDWKVVFLKLENIK